LTIDGDDKFKTLQGGVVTVAFMSYIYYLFVISFIPVFLGEIETSQTQITNFNASNQIDPSASNFTFAVGFTSPLPPSIGTFTLEYI
jgi:hypothetical protein